jgi:hypothetical protein
MMRMISFVIRIQKRRENRKTERRRETQRRRTRRKYCLGKT